MDRTQPRGNAALCLILFIKSARSDITDLKGISQLHGVHAGKGKESPFTRYSIKPTMDILTLLQIAKLSIAIHLPVTVASSK